MPRQLLLAHDSSPEADLALLRAGQLARQLDARLSLAHVLEDGDEASSRRRLEALAADCGLAISDVHLRRGPAVESLAALASGLEADLLLLGRHRAGAVEGFAGTTLERLLLASPVPLLLVVNPTGLPYSRALAALDFSACASRAWQRAAELLPATGELRALHVHESAGLDLPDEAELALDRELFDRLLEDLNAHQAGSARGSHEVRSGERLQCLEEAIAGFDPQVLALGVHSRGEMSSALVGSLTRQLLENPPCDLLLSR
ncbi:universal stress protein [Stutzerimonas tarimensis]|uniref:Universal stress protein n=1 Tax=Stutzerimonas tarimensis TaxID=1507735 RepID=A0ABV7T5F1_9GAMM